MNAWMSISDITKEEQNELAFELEVKQAGYSHRCYRIRGVDKVGRHTYIK